MECQLPAGPCDPEPVGAAFTPSPPSVALEGLPVLDPRALQELRAVQVPGRPDLLGRVVQSFLRVTPGHLDRLQAAIAAQDGAALTQVAHAMKSSSGTLGIARVTWLCWKLEQLGHNGALADAAARLTVLRAECVRAANALTEAVGPYPAPR